MQQQLKGGVKVINYTKDKKYYKKFLKLKYLYYFYGSELFITLKSFKTY